MTNCHNVKSARAHSLANAAAPADLLLLDGATDVTTSSSYSRAQTHSISMAAPAGRAATAKAARAGGFTGKYSA